MAVRGRAGLAALLLCLLTVGVAGPAPAAAQPAPASPRGGATPQLVLEQFPGVLRPSDDDITLQVRVEAGAEQADDGAGRSDEAAGGDLTVEVATHRRTRSRFDFQQAMDAGAVGARLALATEPVEDLPDEGSRLLRISRTRAELGLREGVPAGVYPLRLRLLDEGERVSQVTTSIVVTEEEAGRPVRTTFLLPFDAPPTVLPPPAADGLGASGPATSGPATSGQEAGPPGYDTDAVLAEVGDGGRLAALLAAARAPGAFPVTVASSPRLLQELTDVAGQGSTTTDAAQVAERFLTGLRALVRRPVVAHVALPYGPADLVALVRGGLALEALRHLAVAPQVSEAVLGDPPLEITWPPDGLDEATMQAAVTASGSAVVVLSEDLLAVSAGRELPVSPSPVRRLRTPSGERATALVPDPWLSPALARATGDGPAVDAQRIVAETAALYFERPFAQTTRGLLLAPPQLWAPSPETAEALLAGLAAAPWLSPVSPERLRAGVDPETQPVRLAYPAEAHARELPLDYVAGLGEARSALGALATLLPGGDPVPARLDRRLLTAASVHYRPAARRPEGVALWRSVTAFAEPLFGAVTVNDGLQLILPGAEGTIPVSVSNSSAVPLRVVVTLGESARRNLDFAEGTVEPVVLAPGGTSTLPFQARIRTPGATFPIEVLVTDVDGNRVLARGQLVVRSTAASPVALAVTAGALLFLVGWWVRSARRRRGAQQEATPPPVREPVGR